MNTTMQMQEAIRNFVAEVTELATRAAIEALGGRGKGTRPIHSVSAGARRSKGAVGARRPNRPTSGAGKRSPEQLEALRSRVLRVVQDNLGMSTEEINAKIGTTTAEVALPIRQLVAEKLVRVEGQKRGSRYFPVKR